MFLKNLLIIVLSFGAFLLIIFYSMRIYTHHDEGVAVPMLKGLSSDEAIERLESTGLRYHIDSVYIMDKKPGTVVEQDPDPNTHVKINRTVYLTIVTYNAPKISFPNVVNLTYVEAKAHLARYGLKVSDTLYISGIERDRVLEAKMNGVALIKGEAIPKGSRIQLILGDGKGASEVDIPDLTGLTLSEAIFALRGASLQLGEVTYGNITDSSAVKVVSQYPTATDSLSKVAIGTAVSITLSDK